MRAAPVAPGAARAGPSLVNHMGVPLFTRVRRKNQSPAPVGGPERLPLRWGLIVITAAAAGAAVFPVGGPLAAVGTVCLVAGTLHSVLA